MIKEIDNDSDAAVKGLRVGDVILEVQGRVIKSPDDVIAGLKKARDDNRKAVLLRIKQGDTIRFVGVQLDSKD